MSKKLEEFYKTKEGKKILKKNLKKLHKDFKKERGWFSLEEDEYWRNFRKEDIDETTKSSIKTIKRSEK